jgi:hypothetical protein
VRNGPFILIDRYIRYILIWSGTQPVCSGRQRMISASETGNQFSMLVILFLVNSNSNSRDCMQKKSLTKIGGSVIQAMVVPILCLAMTLPSAERKTRSNPTGHKAAAADRQNGKRRAESRTMAQADTSPSPAAASSPQAITVYGGMHNIATENGGLKPWSSPVPGTLQPGTIIKSASAPPVHGPDEPPPGYPNYYAPPPINQPNPYPQNVQPAPPNN